MYIRIELACKLKQDSATEAIELSLPVFASSYLMISFSDICDEMNKQSGPIPHIILQELVMQRISSTFITIYRDMVSIKDWQCSEQLATQLLFDFQFAMKVLHAGVFDNEEQRTHLTSLSSQVIVRLKSMVLPFKCRLIR